ncbi:MAG: YihY family inner membrane protein [Candidatus Omnitrophica bacterium]|nr:YihY family inner membrane protein [Candidatus Omnitrophota bacterium]
MKNKVVNFLSKDIWRIRLKDTPKKRSFIIRTLRILILSLRGFNEDKCSLRASALTFYSLLSIVPVFAMFFGIAKGFGLDKMLEKQLMDKVPNQNEIIANIINFSHTLLENTKGGVIAGIGVALLFWTVIKVLGNIERSFNDIWGIKGMRSLMRRFADYLSVMLICPILLILASGVTVFINTQAKMIAQKIAVLGVFTPLINFVLDFLPYTVIWVVFTFIYIFIPNTKVNFKSGILAGVVAGTVYQLMQWVYVYFQVGVANYNAIYGSFAALPLFLVWMQLSWRIVLLGAEISFAHQNVDTYEFEPDCLSVSRSFKNMLALRIVNLLSKNFAKGEKAPTAHEVSQALGIPIRLIRDIIYELTETGILVAVQDETSRVPAYQPAVDVNLLSIKYVIDKLKSHGTDSIPVIDTKELKRIKDSLQEFDELLEKSQANLLLKDI